jgi:hypothetical protein
MPKAEGVKNTDMKKTIKSLIVAGLFLALPLLSAAQTPPHPNNGNGGPGGGNTPVGGGAPIGGGLIIMMVMGAPYGSKKVLKAWK